MTTNTLQFPPIPAGVNKSFFEPSASFKKSIARMRLALAVFIIVYLLLFLSSIAIAATMVFLAYIIVVGVHSFWVLVIALGLCLSAFMLVFFLIKFMFKKPPARYTGYEIFAADHPKVFEFIAQLTAETKAPFPKHIYLAADVNAFVSFDSAFWSMFFPTRKNLTIGLGLVNVLNLSEFKAVMAHEFAHFAQRSMRFGSYVHNFNKVIYNMLYDNGGYENTIAAWANLHSYLKLGAIINVKIVEGIQYVLKKTYLYINKEFRVLSREMEFHADALAACSAGSNNIVSSLRRLEIADSGYRTLLSYWSERLGENKCAENLYPQHVVVLQNVAEKYNLQRDGNGIPVIDRKMAAFSEAEVIINDQWASHPLIEDREASVNRLQLTAPAISQAAWSLFDEPEELQKWFTRDLFEDAGLKAGGEVIGTDTFKQDFESEVNQYAYNKIYKGYYNFRPLTVFDIDEAILAGFVEPGVVLEDILSDDNCNLPNKIMGMIQDMRSLEMIDASSKADIKTFDFRGTKHYREDAAGISKLIGEEIESAGKRIEVLDKEIFIFCYRNAESDAQKTELAEAYRDHFKVQQETQKEYDAREKVVNAMAPVYQKMKMNDIYRTIDEVYLQEKTVRPLLRELLDNGELKMLINDKQRVDIEKYLSKKLVYFTEPSYNNQALAIFNDAMSSWFGIAAEREYRSKKALLDLQLAACDDKVSDQKL